MPTDDDKASAWVRFEGEAKRLPTGRPRFGRRYATQTLTLTAAELQAMVDGHAVAVDVGRNVVFVRFEIGAAHALRNARLEAAETETRPRYSERVRVRAAQVRVNADRRARPRVATPAWIVALAGRNVTNE
jgi:hypothetical protein